MKTRMKPESLLANASTDKPKGCSIVYRCIHERPYITYSEISKATGLKIPTVVGRLNDLMYLHKLIVPDGTHNGKALYRVRRSDEPEAQRPKSQAEILQEKLDAVCYHYGITEAQLNEIVQAHNNPELL